jgi:cytochrome c oxidase subunit 3
VSRLRARSWEPLAESGEDRFESTPPQRIGLWIFLAVVTSLFGLFVAAFFMRMGHDALATDWKPFPEPLILWINTGVLIGASIAMQWARSSMSRDDSSRARAALLAAGGLTLAFLVGQFLAWRLMIVTGYFDPRNPAVAFFYVLTIAHALHMLGGVYVWTRLWVRWHEPLAAHRSSEPHVVRRNVRLSVELCAVYWHYLLFVWLVVFALLLTHSIDSQFVFDRLC